MRRSKYWKKCVHDLDRRCKLQKLFDRASCTNVWLVFSWYVWYVVHVIGNMPIAQRDTANDTKQWWCWEIYKQTITNVVLPRHAIQELIIYNSITEICQPGARLANKITRCSAIILHAHILNPRTNWNQEPARPRPQADMFGNLTLRLYMWHVLPDTFDDRHVWSVMCWWHKGILPETQGKRWWCRERTCGVMKTKQKHQCGFTNKCNPNNVN